MGALQSTIRTLFDELRAIIARYQRVQARVDADPGLPVANPLRSFWMHPPAGLPRSKLPAYADVVVVGSGITAASVARTLLAEQPGIAVAVLDARDACGGATGRNGGHLKPYLYEEYGAIKRTYGESEAKKVIRFRQRHVAETIKIAAEEGMVEASGAREVESLDVHFSTEVFELHRKRFEEWQRDCPEESSRYKLYEADEARSKFHLADHCQGVIVGPAGALHPYKLITAIWKRLLTEYKDKFALCTHTPCTQISPPSPESLSSAYTVHTPRGKILTPHVVHATNAHVSHLLPKMRGKIIPARATCTAQRPGRGCTPSTADGGRSWMLYHARGYDYLTQLPTDADGYSGELIFGGGFMLAEDGLGEVGRADDGAMNGVVATYLGGALPTLFGQANWGPEEYVDDREASEDVADGWSAGRVKAVWTGILSASADGMPWVGRVPPKVAERPAPKRANGKAAELTVEPGEWIAAGYSGDGMSSALLSGRAVAYMILGKEDEHKVSEWLPESLVITQKRWAKAKAGNTPSETRVPAASVKPTPTKVPGPTK